MTHFTPAPIPEQPSYPWPTWAPGVDPPEIEIHLKCPVCDFDCIHIASAVVNQNGLVTTVDRDNDRLDPNGPSSGRGSQVIVSFFCESGHTFAHVYQFHKGATSMRLVIGPEVDAALPQSELWRN